MIRKRKLVCLPEVSKGGAIIAERPVTSQKNAEHQAAVHTQVKVVETRMLTRI